MFCPQCGSTQSDDLKFCKSCGANLHALRRIMASKDESDEKFDLSRTWVAEMFMTRDEIDRRRGTTPETKRRNEIKAGIITASVGAGLMILLFVLMEGIILGGRVSDAAAAILSRLWIVGIIPLLVGAALIFNGMVVSRKGKQEKDTGTVLDAGADPAFLPPAETRGLAGSVPFSVTDETTQHLVEPVPVARRAKGQETKDL